MNYEILPIREEDSDYIDDRIVEYNLAKMPAECEAKKEGCTIIQLDTFDWQAKGFYKNGYSVFGELKNCPKGHSRYYMSKSL